MQVTPPTKPSEVLEAAKEFLAPKRFRALRRVIHICYALDEVKSIHPESKEAINEVQEYILDCLKPAISLGGWLADQGAVEQFDCFDTLDGMQKMYITRLAWIDHMIVLYREQGR